MKLPTVPGAIRQAAAVVAVLIALSMGVGSSWLAAVRYTPPVSIPTLTAAQAAWRACTIFVQHKAGIPAREAQPYGEAGVHSQAGGSQYTVTIYYARRSVVYQCFMRVGDSGDLQLVRLEEGR